MDLTANCCEKVSSALPSPFWKPAGSSPISAPTMLAVADTFRAVNM